MTFITCKDRVQLYDFKERAWCRSRIRGRALYRDASRAANVLGPPPSSGGDPELEGGVNVSLRKYGVVHGTLI